MTILADWIPRRTRVYFPEASGAWGTSWVVCHQWTEAGLADLTSSKHCYRATDSFAEVVQFYKKKDLREALALTSKYNKCLFCRSDTGVCSERVSRNLSVHNVAETLQCVGRICTLEAKQSDAQFRRSSIIFSPKGILRAAPLQFDCIDCASFICIMKAVRHIYHHRW